MTTEEEARISTRPPHWTMCCEFQVWNPPEGEKENMIRMNYITWPPKKDSGSGSDRKLTTDH